MYEPEDGRVVYQHRQPRHRAAHQRPCRTRPPSTMAAIFGGRWILDGGPGRAWVGAQPLAATIGRLVPRHQMSASRIRCGFDLLSRPPAATIDRALVIIGKARPRASRFPSGLLRDAADVSPELLRRGVIPTP